MKTLYICAAIVLLCANSLPVKAQRIFHGQINIPCELKQEDNFLILNMEIDLKKLKINKDRTLTLTPILVGDEKIAAFPPVLINGKKRHKVYERAVALGKGDEYVDVEPYAVVTPGKKGNHIHYTYEIPYEKWMDKANLDIEQNLCGCGKFSPELIVERLVDWAFIEEEETGPIVAYVRPMNEMLKLRDEQWEAFLDFPLAKATILPDFGNNPTELAKLRDGLNAIKGDQNLSVTQIEITGYASPDGRFESNDRLSKERADALAEYLSLTLTFPKEIYQVNGGGEDWRGLLKMVESSDISPKNQIISIIKFTPPEKREQQLMSWANGVPYRIMERDFFPRLRRVVCRINYSVRKFDIEEAKEIFKTHPQQLSMEELFLVANTYPEGSRSFVEVFETAAELYPENKIANLNIAAAALKAKDVERAEKYLQLAEDDSPEYTNNLGVLYLLREDYEAAQDLFTQAAGQELEAAIQNLEQLEQSDI
jgi:tetratricopeptide (TPR) repeat protein